MLSCSFTSPSTAALVAPFFSWHSSSADHLFTSTQLHSVLNYKLNQIVFALLFRGITLFAIILLLYFWYAWNTFKIWCCCCCYCAYTHTQCESKTKSGVLVWAADSTPMLYYAYVINNAAQNIDRYIGSMVSWDDIEPHIQDWCHRQISSVHTKHSTAQRTQLLEQSKAKQWNGR